MRDDKQIAEHQRSVYRSRQVPPGWGGRSTPPGSRTSTCDERGDVDHRRAFHLREETLNRTPSHGIVTGDLREQGIIRRALGVERKGRCEVILRRELIEALTDNGEILPLIPVHPRRLSLTGAPHCGQLAGLQDSACVTWPCEQNEARNANVVHDGAFAGCRVCMKLSYGTLLGTRALAFAISIIGPLIHAIGYSPLHRAF